MYPITIILIINKKFRTAMYTDVQRKPSCSHYIVTTTIMHSNNCYYDCCHFCILITIVTMGCFVTIMVATKSWFVYKRFMEPDSHPLPFIVKCRYIVLDYVIIDSLRKTGKLFNSSIISFLCYVCYINRRKSFPVDGVVWFESDQ